MESSKQNKALLFDEIRKIHVEATPEEVVRQKLLKKMLYELGYPRELIGVEKELKQLPHLFSETFSLPERRIDILCFGKGIHPSFALYPLLLVECKAKKIDETAKFQLIGYNHFVKAFFIALAAEREIHLGFYDRRKGDYEFKPFLPSYKDLMGAIKR